MRIGIDFDNTIVCYDQVFHAAARERELIPVEVPVSKEAVRNYLRSIDREEDWTKLQGYVYGPRMRDALPFAGVMEFFARCAEAQLPVWIISHKTRYPFQGPQYDLHESARQWIADHGLLDADRVGLPADHVFFELTKAAKLERVQQVGCTHFIDDLPEFLAEKDFPKGVQRILFDPQDHHPDERRFLRATSWEQVWELVKP
jgi:hypothetical protein